MTDASKAPGQDATPHSIETTNVIELSPADQLRVALALLHPPEPPAALVRAVERHRQLLRSS